MANYQYSADLVDDILFRVGEPTDGTSDFNAVALQYLNRGLFALARGGQEIDQDLPPQDWWWLRKSPPGVLTLEPKITAGTVNVTNNLTSITFSSAPAASVKDWFFQVDGHPDVFRISAHTAGATGATLDSVYTGDTDTAAKYKLMKLEYALASDLLRPLSPFRAYQSGQSEIEIVSQPVLDSRWPLRLIQGGISTRFAMVGERTARMNKYGGDAAADLIRVEYDYIYRPTALTDSGTEEPLVPWMYRNLLSDIGSYFLFMDKNDSRADATGLAARGGLRAMARENRGRDILASRDFGKIYPRPETLPEELEPLRTQTGLIIG